MNKHNCPDLLQGLTSNDVEFASLNGLTNKSPKIKEQQVTGILSKNIFTLFNLINIVLALMLLYARSYRNMLFLLVVIVNTFIGSFQEIRAKKIRDKLSLLYKKKLRCIRDAVECDVLPENLVLYDLIVLNVGDQIPSDCLVEKGLGSVNESLITGESDSVLKQPGDQLYGGSFIAEGSFYVRITKLSKDSYISLLQAELRLYKRPHSVLLYSMNQIIKISTFIIIPLGILLYYKYCIMGTLVFEKAIPSIVAAMIGMIPSGLILLTSIALAVGVINLAKQNALVNELNGIENLARVNVLCLDKTGTITTGNMELKEIVPINNTMEYCKDSLEYYAQNISDTGETLKALRKGLNISNYVDVDFDTTVQFNSLRKWSSVKKQNSNIIIGAPSFITEDAQVLAKVSSIAQKGQRVLLCANCSDQLTSNTNMLNIKTTAICLIVLSDMIRNNIKDTINYFYKQNVDVKVISGDDTSTVAHIANEVGIKNSENAVDNSMLVNDDVLNRVYEYNVFGRIIPQNKQKILNKLQSLGHKVAMIGDGVNDIPPLKAADCSISMGSGSEATKGISQIVLLDNNFNTMPRIVYEGRRVINNITLASSLFLIKTIFSMLLSFASVLFSFQYPFAPIQLTLIASLTIGIPSFFLSFEANKNRVHGNFLKNVFLNALPGGVSVFMLISLVLYFNNKLGIKASELSTLISIITFITLMWALFKIIRPFNKYRLLLFMLLTIAFCLIATVFSQFFYFTSISVKSIYIVLVSTIIAPLLQFLLYILFSTMFNYKEKL